MKREAQKYTRSYEKSKAVLDFMKREEQNLVGNYDQQLWNAANLSLDLTIKSIPNFDTELKIYKTLMERLRTICQGKQLHTGCLYHDEGCGSRCINDFVHSPEYREITAQ
mmetsp:Transcript_7622/g.9688  ORF Transcript_7622/g.9688 Transcript_7622/m.9688 type:complete len:110 (-) Transcript_7622:393-722(-)